MISSRRKSCSACARGKRRCNLEFPQCGRCLARRATCVYPWSSTEETQEAESIKLWHQVPQEGPCGFPGQSRSTRVPQSSGDLLQPDHHQVDDDTQTDRARLTSCPDFVPLADDITGRQKITSFFTPDVQRQSTYKLHQNTGLSVPTSRDSQSSHVIDLPLIPLGGTGSRYVLTHNTFRARAEYAASRLFRQVRALAETGQTSFIHHTQTEDSGILRDAFTASSISTTRNPANESLVISEISRRAKALIEATETAISLMPPSSHSVMNHDVLPYIQAMLVYQCMRLFATGNVVQQTQAELDAELLARWIDILQEQTQCSWDNFSCSTQLDHCSWKSWIHRESIRRTMVFAELLDGTYTFLKTGWYQPSARLTRMSFAGHAATWEARSPAEWRGTIGENPWIELRLSNFLEDINVVFPDDLDELGVIILVSYEGIDKVREWVGDDGKLLDKWGLTGGSDSLSSCY